MATKEASDKSSETMLFKIADRVAQGFLKATPLHIKTLLDNVDKETGLMSNETWGKWCDKLVTGGFCDQDTADSLKQLAEYKFPWGGILMVLTILKVKMTDLQSIMDIYGLDRQYSDQAKTTPHPAPVDNLVRSMILDPARTNENRAQLKRLGYDKTQIDNIILSYYRTVEEDTIRTNFLRGNIDETIMYERMRELGYTDVRTAEIIQTWKVLPGPGDLLQMVAKEAFEPDIYTKLGLAAEFPTEQVKWLKEQGISEAWAMKYWIAHWDQPSIGQGFEMLHRDVITNAELDLLFRAVEIPSFWRDKLTEIAYHPYTRVDVRRMHDLGILKDADLIRAYMDLGFDAEKALNMANFTIAFNASHEKDLTRGAILDSYEEGLISKSDAIDLMIEQDYSEDLADYYIALTDFNRDKKLQTLLLTNIREEFLLGFSSEQSARERLNKMGLRGDKIDALIDAWHLDQYKYQNIPSKNDMDSFLIRGIVNEGQYKDVLTRHGYSLTHISWYLSELDPDRKAPDRLPSRTDLTGWLSKGIITDTVWSEGMVNLGYNTTDIERYKRSI